MPNWLIKSALQRVISWLPASHFWNALFQRYATRSLELTRESFERRLEHCRQHLDFFFEARPDAQSGFRAVELGTGWFPTVPTGLYLCGAEEVDTYDIASLVSGPRLKQMLDRFTEYDRAGELRNFLPRYKPERIAKLREISLQAERSSPADLLRRLNIHFRVQDAQKTGLLPGKADLFVSTAVLEYIPHPVLKSILLEFRRVGSPRAVQSHYINLRDQYSYFDSAITPFNYLRFTAKKWKYFNSPITWQNRLRISDYRQLFAETGYRILHERNISGEIATLQKIELAPEFRHYRVEDLLVLFSWLVAAPAQT